MEIITLYESGLTDGYKTFGDGKYYLSESEANVASIKHGGYGCIITHNKVAKIDGKHYNLEKVEPIFLTDPKEEQEWLKQIALGKLTAADRKVLGLG